MRIYYIIAKMGFQRDNVPLAGLGGAQYELSRSDTFLDRRTALSKAERAGFLFVQLQSILSDAICAEAAVVVSVAVMSIHLHKNSIKIHLPKW